MTSNTIETTTKSELYKPIRQMKRTQYAFYTCASGCESHCVTQCNQVLRNAASIGQMAAEMTMARNG